MLYTKDEPNSQDLMAHLTTHDYDDGEKWVQQKWFW